MNVRSAFSHEGMVVFVVTYCRREDWYIASLGQGIEEKTRYFIAFKSRLIRP